MTPEQINALREWIRAIIRVEACSFTSYPFAMCEDAIRENELAKDVMEAFKEVPSSDAYALQEV